MLVRGGPANSGTKRPKQPRPTQWRCICGQANAAHWATCSAPGCREKRPTGLNK